MIADMKKYIIEMIMILGYFNSIPCLAYDFEVDGLCYNIISSNQVEVTYKGYYDQGDYSGKLVIPEKVKYGGKEYIVSVIGDNAFSWCRGLTGSLVIPNSVTHIGYCAFFCCSGLTGSLTIPNSVTSIAGQAFDGCSSLTGSLIIPNSVTTIAHRAFKGCKFTGSLIIPHSVTTIEEGVFEECSGFTGSLIIPSSVSSIGNYAFYGCSGFTGFLTIPSSVTSIGDDAFYGCSGITSLFLPSSVTSIGYKAFMYCKRLSYVESQMETPFSFGDDVFLGIASNAILVIPKGESYPYGIIKWFAEIRRKSASYILSISSSGNGYASYNGTTIRNKTEDFSLIEGTSPKITFTPDNGYKIKSVKVNNSAVSVSNNQYTISSINANTTVSVEFEAIPPTTYTLSITATGSGSASYNGTVVRGKTSPFTVNEGTNATITFTPDNGYRIKTVKVNNSAVTVTNNQYSVSNIRANTTISVEFEAIPPTTYTLSITASGSGSASYNGTVVRGKTSPFTVNEGTNATITFTPDNGYRIKTVKVNNSAVTVTNNQYTISNIKANTTVSVEFEAIPPTTYTLSITATGSGSASYNGTVVRGKTSRFTVNEGANITIIFSPDNGYQIKSLKVNNVSATAQNNQYTISNINANTTVEVEFEAIIKTFSVDNVNYSVVSVSDRTIHLASGNYGVFLEVPVKVSYQNENWSVTGVENGALANNSELAAIIWHPETAFTEQISNPNLLLYVKQAQYAPNSIKNVVVNGVANSIILTDAASGNNFYCPQTFTTFNIIYSHNYGMTTGIGEARGWETIALPFDVQKVTHQSKGEIVSFSNWKRGDSKKPFWLMELSGSGWTLAESIKANTPYIISMPNNPDYKSGFILNGNVTFSAEYVTIPKTEDINTSKFNNRTFMPTFVNQAKDYGIYALNVINDIEHNTYGSTEGSCFVSDLRPVHPFEAYMTTTSSTRSIGIDEGMATGILELIREIPDEGNIRIYNLNGQIVKTARGKSIEEVVRELPSGVYIINGKTILF